MSVANWKEREKEQRRNDILDVAENLFFSKGYDNVSMSGIAKKVGLGKATLYIYFDGKEELFFAVVLRGVKILNKIIKEKVEKEDTGLEKLVAFKKAYSEFIKAFSDYFKAYNYFQSGRFDLTGIMNAYSDICKESQIYAIHIPKAFSVVNVSEHIKDILKLRSEIFLILCESIKMGIKEGTIRSDVDPMKIAVMQILISENIGNLSLDLKIIVESQGIRSEEFVKDLDNFISQLYIKND